MSNILKLIRIGFLPPNYKENDLKRTIYYKFWESFRTRCVFANVKHLENGSISIKCSQLSSSCDFNACPIIKEAIESYEKENKTY